MAYIIGLISKKEEKELKRRGWELEDPPEHYDDWNNPIDRYAEKDGLRYRMVYVDNDMFAIMNGPDWEKGLSPIPLKRDGFRVMPEDQKPKRRVRCKFCKQLTSKQTAHRHDGGWVGDDCCWDERLRMTE